MRFLILSPNDPRFLDWLYSENPGLEKASYAEQIRVQNESLYFRSNYYSENLFKLGHEAYELQVNNEFAQKAWAREHGLSIEDPAPERLQVKSSLLRARRKAAQTPLRYLKPFFRPLLRHLDRQPSWVSGILAAQIRYYKPDVLLNKSMYLVNSDFLRTVRPFVRLLVGQHEAGLFCEPLPKSEDWRCYDLIISSFTPTIEWFYKKEIPAELLRLCFEPRVLSYLNGDKNGTIPVSFVGSLLMHRSRIQFLEDLCTQLDIQIWAPQVEHLDLESSIRKAYMGQAWGLQMYQIFANSYITLNHHGDCPPYANNMRLYDATGVGTLLITDWKVNLHELFELDIEVVAYRSVDECAELIKHYLNNEAEREAIARAGQQRTLKDHTYFQRMIELVDLVSKYL